MSATAFSTSSANTLTAQPNVLGEKLILRSTSAADAGNASVTGLVAGAATLATNALLGQRELQTAQSFTSLSSLQLSAAQAGTVAVYGQGIAAAGDLRIDANPANNDTILIGLAGFVRTYTFKAALTGAANEVKIGAATSDTAANLAAAINAGAGSGATYGTGTTANAFVSAAAAASVVSLLDRIAIARQVAWSVSQGVGATISIRGMVGGVTGQLLAQATAGVTQVFNSLSLQSEDLVALSLPALLTPVFSAIQVGGRSCTLRFKAVAAAGQAMAVSYQTSSDGQNWANGLTAIGGDFTAGYTVAAPLFVHPSETNIEYLRLVISANARTADTAFDARVIY